MENISKRGRNLLRNKLSSAKSTISNDRKKTNVKDSSGNEKRAVKAKKAPQYYSTDEEPKEKSSTKSKKASKSKTNSSEDEIEEDQPATKSKKTSESESDNEETEEHHSSKLQKGFKGKYSSDEDVEVTTSVKSKENSKCKYQSTDEGSEEKSGTKSMTTSESENSSTGEESDGKSVTKSRMKSGSEKSSTGEESDNEKLVVKAKKKPGYPVKKTKSASEDSSNDDETEENPVRKYNKPSKHVSYSSKEPTEKKHSVEPTKALKSTSEGKTGRKYVVKSNTTSEEEYSSNDEEQTERKPSTKTKNKQEKYEYSSTDDDETDEEPDEKPTPRQTKKSKSKFSSDEDTPPAKLKKRTNCASSSGSENDDEKCPYSRTKSKSQSTSSNEDYSSDDERSGPRRRTSLSERPPWCSSIKLTPAEKSESRKPLLAETKVPGFYLLLLNGRQEEKVKKEKAKDNDRRKKLYSSETSDRINSERSGACLVHQRRIKSAELQKVANEGKRMKVVSFQEQNTYHGRMKNKSTPVIGSRSPSRNNANSSTVSLDDSDSTSSNASKKPYRPKILSPIKLLADEKKRKADAKNKSVTKNKSETKSKSGTKDKPEAKDQPEAETTPEGGSTTESSSDSDSPSYYGQETIAHFVDAAKEVFSSVTKMSMPFINEVQKVDPVEVSSKLACEIKECVTNGENCIEYDFDEPEHDLIPIITTSDDSMPPVEKVSTEQFVSEVPSLKTECVVSILGNAQPVSSNQVSLKSEFSNISRDERKLLTINYIREKASNVPLTSAVVSQTSNKSKKSGFKNIFKGISSMFKRNKTSQTE